jgi:drug/metabolite transporter (DMT)-like permease
MLGYALVVTRGELQSVLTSGSGWGDSLVFSGSLCWLVYVLVFMRFSTWSALRFTTLTCIAGGVATTVITAIASFTDLAVAPSASELLEHLPAIAFLVVGTGVLGVLSWNAGTQLIGALNAALFYALIPVVAFLIRAAQGERFAVVELVGAALVVVALIANSLYIRKQSHSARLIVQS